MHGLPPPSPHKKRHFLIFVKAKWNAVFEKLSPFSKLKSAKLWATMAPFLLDRYKSKKKILQNDFIHPRSNSEWWSNVWEISRTVLQKTGKKSIIHVQVLSLSVRVSKLGIHNWIENIKCCVCGCECAWKLEVSDVSPLELHFHISFNGDFQWFMYDCDSTN